MTDKAREAINQIDQELKTISDYARSVGYYRPPAEIERDLRPHINQVLLSEQDIRQALDRLDELEELEKSNTELIGVFNVRELEQEEQLATAKKWILQQTKDLAKSRGDVKTLIALVSSRDFRPGPCPEGVDECKDGSDTDEECFECWQSWLAKGTP